jgi:tetratricopeptide (TPR) repeat protein
MLVVSAFVFATHLYGAQGAQLFAAPGTQRDEIAGILAAAGAALEAGELDRAESSFARAASLAPSDARARLGLCEVEVQRQRPVEALEHCREARRLAPEAPLPAVRIGQILAQMGASAEALAAFTDARELDATDPSAYLLPALLLRDAGQRDQAVALLEQGLRDATPLPEVAEELSLVLLSLGEVARARAVSEEALQRWPDSAALELALGLALVSARDELPRAAALLERALDHGAPGPGRIHLELGRLLLDLRHPEEAIEHIRTAISTRPEDPEGYYRLGLALRATGDTAGAMTALNRFQELSGNRDAGEWEAKEVTAALNEAQKFSLENRLFSALERVDAVLVKHPDVSRGHALRAKILSSLKRDPEALAAATRARELGPAVAEHHYLEGLFLVRSGQTGAGAERLRRALALDPTIANAHRVLGILASSHGRASEAAGHFRLAIEHGGETAELRGRLDAALADLGTAGAAAVGSQPEL